VNQGPLPAWEIPREFWAAELFGGSPERIPFFLESNPARIWNLNTQPHSLVATVVMPGKIGWVCFLGLLRDSSPAFQFPCDNDHFWDSVLSWFTLQGCPAIQFLSESLAPGSRETTGAKIQLPGCFRFICNFLDLEWSTSHPLPSADQTSPPWQILKEAIASEKTDLAIATMDASGDCPELAQIRSNSAAWEALLQVHGRTKRCWVLEISGVPSGILLGYPAEGEKVGLVSYLGLIPEVRNQGWGKRFLREFLEESQGNPVLVEGDLPRLFKVATMVDARNQPARRLYESLGFRKKSQGQFHLAFLQPLS